MEVIFGGDIVAAYREAQPPRAPLIMDLGTERIELKSLDRNGNGKIDNGGELFGD